KSSGGPRGRVLVGGLAGGVLAGLGAVVLWTLLDRRVRGDADVKRRLGLPTLALVPTADGDPLLLRRPAVDPQATAFGLAAAVLRSYLEERQFRTVYVTSAEAGEGKSTAAANLAVALARRGLTVALVDADLRSPSLGSMFGVDESYGLAQILLGGELQAELPAGETPLTSLRVLPAGPTADVPPEILAAERMGEILRALAERHDVVVVDGPPLQAGGDAVTLARVAHTVVWVVRAGVTPGGRLGWMRHVLRNVRADVAGVLLTGAASDAPERTYAFNETAPR
ncbi:MAG TPA: CpsD/CapB family tyrosine-protein kinase, partial [Planctomycetota bacterium]|nr:CpsD/CapB family tyrosine-protein kinase [Planctomycetota bacterium]